jgi:hypothetical protein
MCGTQWKGSPPPRLSGAAPYTRFVRAERDHLSRTRDELQAITDGLGRLKAQVEAL